MGDQKVRGWARDPRGVRLSAFRTEPWPITALGGEKSHYGKITAKCPVTAKIRRSVRTAKWSYGVLSTRRNVHTAKCPNGEMPHGELSHGEMSHGEMSGNRFQYGEPG